MWCCESLIWGCLVEFIGQAYIDFVWFISQELRTSDTRCLLVATCPYLTFTLWIFIQYIIWRPLLRYHLSIRFMCTKEEYKLAHVFFWVIFNSHCSGKGVDGGGKGERGVGKVFSLYTFSRLFSLIFSFLIFVMRTSFWCSTAKLKSNTRKLPTNLGCPHTNIHDREIFRI